MELFAAWCEATGRDIGTAGPDEIELFCLEVQAGADETARRRRAVRRLLDLEAPRPPERLDPARVSDALGRAVIGGWPDGLVGRRNAAVLALAAAGATRRQLAALVVGDLSGPPMTVRLNGSASTPLVVSNPPGSCLACAVSRWLRALGTIDRRRQLACLAAVTAASTSTHDCAVALPYFGDRGWPLLPSIDHRGLVGHSGLSATALSGILTRALSDTATGEDAPDGPNRSGPGRPTPDPEAGRRARAEATRRLEATIAALEAVEADLERRGLLEAGHLP